MVSNLHRTVTLGRTIIFWWFISNFQFNSETKLGQHTLAVACCTEGKASWRQCGVKHGHYCCVKALVLVQVTQAVQQDEAYTVCKFEAAQTVALMCLVVTRTVCRICDHRAMGWASPRVLLPSWTCIAETVRASKSTPTRLAFDTRAECTPQGHQHPHAPQLGQEPVVHLLNFGVRDTRCGDA